MILAGIDYSYTSPAICVYDTLQAFEFSNLKFFVLSGMKTREGIHGNIRIDLLKNKDWLSQEDRFQKIFNWSSAILDAERVEEAVIEGYAMGSTSGFVFDIAENTSLLKNWMYRRGMVFYKSPPTATKKVFTGKGNAKKEQMCDVFEQRTGVQLETILNIKKYSKPLDDLADSYANMMMHPHFGLSGDSIKRA